MGDKNHDRGRPTTCLPRRPTSRKVDRQLVP